MWFYFSKYFLVVFVIVLSNLAHADRWKDDINLQDWNTSVQTRSIEQLPPIKRLLESFVESDSNTITLRYPGGDAGEKWVEQLMSALVSLGIPSSYVIIEPGSGKQDRIKLIVTQN